MRSPRPCRSSNASQTEQMQSSATCWGTTHILRKAAALLTKTSRGISGLVLGDLIAIDATRNRFPADALPPYSQICASKKERRNDGWTERENSVRVPAVTHRLTAPGRVAPAIRAHKGIGGYTPHPKVCRCQHMRVVRTFVVAATTLVGSWFGNAA